MCTYSIFKAVLRSHDLNLPMYCWYRAGNKLFICSPEKLLRKALCPSTCFTAVIKLIYFIFLISIFSRRKRTNLIWCWVLDQIF